MPSKLRHVEEMSPLQIEKAKRESMGKENQAPGFTGPDLLRGFVVPDLCLNFQQATEKYFAREAAGGVLQFDGENDPELIRAEFRALGYKA